jgi:hypothetical protein
VLATRKASTPSVSASRRRVLQPPTAIQVERLLTDNVFALTLHDPRPGLSPARHTATAHRSPNRPADQRAGRTLHSARCWAAGLTASILRLHCRTHPRPCTAGLYHNNHHQPTPSPQPRQHLSPAEQPAWDLHLAQPLGSSAVWGSPCAVSLPRSSSPCSPSSPLRRDGAHAPRARPLTSCSVATRTAVFRGIEAHRRRHADDGDCASNLETPARRRHGLGGR